MTDPCLGLPHCHACATWHLRRVRLTFLLLGALVAVLIHLAVERLAAGGP